MDAKSLQKAKLLHKMFTDSQMKLAVMLQESAVPASQLAQQLNLEPSEIRALLDLAPKTKVALPEITHKVNEQVPSSVLAELRDMKTARARVLSPAAQTAALDELGYKQAEGVADLEKWMSGRNNGAPLDIFGLAVVSDKADIGMGAERVVRCVSDIAKHSVMLRIPLNDVITDATVAASRFGQLLSSALKTKTISTLRATSTFAAFLALQRANPESPWRTYLDMVPQTFNGLPHMWSDKDLASIKETVLHSTALGIKKDLVDDYAAIKKHVLDKHSKKLGTFTYEDFVWGTGVVFSRTFMISVDKKMTRLMVPFGDMFNHDESKETAAFAYDPKSKSFFYFAVDDVKKGEEVFTSYGERCNSEMLGGYGFCLENNIRYNRTMVQYQFDQDKHSFKISAQYTNRAVMKCFSLLRVILSPDRNKIRIYRPEMSGLQLSKLQSNAKEDVFDLKTMLVHPVDPDCEVQVLDAVRQGVQMQLNSLNRLSDPADDKKLIANESAPYNARNAARIRVGEREVCLFWRDLSLEVTKMYETNDSWELFVSAMRARFTSHEQSTMQQRLEENYINGVWSSWLAAK